MGLDYSDFTEAYNYLHPIEKGCALSAMHYINYKTKDRRYEIKPATPKRRYLSRSADPVHPGWPPQSQQLKMRVQHPSSTLLPFFVQAAYQSLMHV